MNNLLKQNNFPQVILPDNSPSKEILQMASNTEEDETTQKRTPADMEEDADVCQEDINEQQEEEEMSVLEDIKERDIGVEIITKKSE